MVLWNVPVKFRSASRQRLSATVKCLDIWALVWQDFIEILTVNSRTCSHSNIEQMISRNLDRLQLACTYCAFLADALMVRNKLYAHAHTTNLGHCHDSLHLWPLPFPPVQVPPLVWPHPAPAPDQWGGRVGDKTPQSRGERGERMRWLAGGIHPPCGHAYSEPNSQRHKVVEARVCKYSARSNELGEDRRACSQFSAQTTHTCPAPLVC